MHWYEGSIAEAVNLSKQRNAIFVVFVEGDNDLSAEMASTIDNSDVLKRLADKENILAIKLKSGSANYTHFAQIYQFVPVPSLFFIGRNGTPLEVVCAGVEPNSLADRIDRILEQHRKEKPQSTKASPSSSGIQQQTVELLRAEAAVEAPLLNKETHGKREAEPETSSGKKIQKTVYHEVSKSGKEYDVVCDGDVCVRVPTGSSDGSGPSHHGQPEKPSDTTAVDNNNSEMVTEGEKMERAKELIEARRREKVAKEKELEKQKELERRAVGQGVAELKKWQADQELKQIQEERKREKMENNLARQRILEQIAQDRAERRARDQPPTAPTVPTAPTTTANTSGDGGTRARIQFKLPNGTSHTANFDASGTLADVQQYVADNLQLSSSRFSLWTAFPRRELRDGAETLRQLQLTPSGALLVLPTNTQQTVPHTSTVNGFIAFFTQLITSFLLQPSMQVFNWVRQRLFPSLDPPRPSDPPQGPASPPQNNAGVRRRGNIHRLGEERGNDDDNNTWNGNSTQQM